MTLLKGQCVISFVGPFLSSNMLKDALIIGDFKSQFDEMIFFFPFPSLGWFLSVKAVIVQYNKGDCGQNKYPIEKELQDFE